jgi:hypothetical protein
VDHPNFEPYEPIFGNAPERNARTGSCALVATPPDAELFIVLVGVTGPPGHASFANAYDVAVVPDGVAQVRWTFGDIAGKPGRVVDAPAADNVAVVPYMRSAGEARLVRAAWFASNGRAIPTSDQALLRAIAARKAVLSARIVRYDARHSYRAAPALLADFAVFAVTSRTGVRTGAEKSGIRRRDRNSFWIARGCASPRPTRWVTTSGRIHAIPAVRDPRATAAAGVSQAIHQRARMELISIVAATSVYAPAPMALDPFVEDPHLVGLFVRR